MAPIVFSITLKIVPFQKKERAKQSALVLVGSAWLAAATRTQRSAEIKENRGETKEGREKLWFHTQVAVKDVYLRRPVSPLCPN